MTEHWTEHPEAMNAAAARQVERLLDNAPYCAAYHLLHVAALSNVKSPRLSAAVKAAAIRVPSRRRLLSLAARGEHEWLDMAEQAGRQSARAATDATDFQLIDRFLDQMHIAGEVSLASYNVADISTISTPTIDPADTQPDATATPPADDQMSIIDDFIQAEQSGALFVPQPSPQTPQDDADSASHDIANIRDKAFLTESLAKIYIKQHKYEQALAIIRRLNLKYPKKNTYFADQIRFLETIIDYQKQNNTK